MVCRKLARVLGTLLVFLLLQVACAPQTVIVKETVAVEKEVEKEVTKVVEKEVEKKVVVTQPASTLALGLWGKTSPNNFCTLATTTGQDVWLRRLLGATLATTSEDGSELVPDLAESWEVNPDGTSWVFFLRKDVKWHDGEPFMADDLEFTLDLVLSPEAGGYRAVFADIVRGVEVIDDYTIKFNMVRSIFTGTFGSDSDLRSLVQDLIPVPKHILDKDDISPAEVCASDWAQKNYIGLGPFQVIGATVGEARFEEDSYVFLEPHAQYHDSPSQLASLEINFAANPETLLSSLIAGVFAYAQISPGFVDNVEQSENLFIPENVSLLAVNADQAVWPPSDPYLKRALIDVPRQTLVPYRVTFAEVQQKIGNAILLPEHPETSEAIQKLQAKGILNVRINEARTVTFWDEVAIYHLAPIGPQDVPPDEAALLELAGRNDGFVIATQVLQGDPGGGAVPGPAVMRVHLDEEKKPEIRYVDPDGNVVGTVPANKVEYGPDVYVDIPEAGIDQGTAQCYVRILGIRFRCRCR